MPLWTLAPRLFLSFVVSAVPGPGVTGRLAPGLAPRALAGAGALFAADRRVVYRLEGEGRIATVLESPEVVDGLAASGNTLWISAGRALWRYEGPHLVATAAWPETPRGLAAADGLLWTSFPPYRDVSALDPCSLTARARIPTPARRIVGLAVTQRALYVLDGADERLYVLDRRRGKVTRILPLPVARPRDVALYGGAVWVCARGERGVLQLAASLGPHVGPERRHTVALWVRVQNPTATTLVADVFLPLPRSNERQRIYWCWRFTPGRTRSPPAPGIWRVRLTLSPGETGYACWLAGLGTRRLVVFHDPRACSAPPVRVRTPKRFGAGSEPVRNLARSLPPGLSPLQFLAAVSEAVGRALHYRLDGRWSPAETVLQQGHGSCSEYTFVTLGLLAARGLWGRYVGTTFRRGRGVYEDWVGHRFAECFVPDLGWVPVDATWNDTTPPRRKYVGLAGAEHLYLVRARGAVPGLGWRYRGHAVPVGQRRPVRILRYAVWLPFVAERRAAALREALAAARPLRDCAAEEQAFVGELAAALTGTWPRLRRIRVLQALEAGDAALALLSLRADAEAQAVRRWLRTRFAPADPYRLLAEDSLARKESPAGWELRFFLLRRSLGFPRRPHPAAEQ